MTWHELARNAAQSHRAVKGVRMSVNAARKGGNSYPRFVVSLGHDVMAECNLAIGRRVRCFIGMGPQEGSLFIAPLPLEETRLGYLLSGKARSKATGTFSMSVLRLGKTARYIKAVAAKWSLSAEEVEIEGCKVRMSGITVIIPGDIQRGGLLGGNGHAST